MINKQEIGRLGEDIAVKYLEKKRYRILDRNFEKQIGSMKFGEIDIVARKDKTIVSCEVKALSAEKGFSPEQKVDFRKIEKITKMAEIWLDKHKKRQDTMW